MRVGGNSCGLKIAVPPSQAVTGGLVLCSGSAMATLLHVLFKRAGPALPAHSSADIHSIILIPEPLASCTDLEKHFETMHKLKPQALAPSKGILQQVPGPLSDTGKLQNAQQATKHCASALVLSCPLPFVKVCSSQNFPCPFCMGDVELAWGKDTAQDPMSLGNAADPTCCTNY